MKTIQIKWSRITMTFLMVGWLVSYLPYPGLPTLPTTLLSMLRILQQPQLSQN